MIQPRDIERMFRQEFRDLMPNVIWENEDGVYEVFGHYRIVSESAGFRVFCSATDAGVFSTTRTALSWCIADKYRAYNLARELLETDQKLTLLTNDIVARVTVADRGTQWNFKDAVATKLETKIIRKKQLENQLTKCVNWAKYCQQRGFNNETARTGRGQPNKASR